MHPPRDGHPALASDLMEEFRAMAVDGPVFGGFLNGAFGPDDFERDADADWPCRLRPPALKRFLEKFEARMNSPLSHPDEGQRLDYRRVMQRQCRHLVEVIAGRGEYRPIRIR
ncbi:CRISPR-associated endonuclease Cas1 [Methylomagnum sp.]